uniref:uncharacterized protein LOC113475460 n=1 Tax=Ciona intestinalis TaxID=7719 RepID=UPI000EF485BF|nr:uncharacterized protein LOC113475460 [Ciona intestinalis]|eukprot:XP_026695433.1 uncharacterized protein LOC113475460 [Ciona intestinalis]
MTENSCGTSETIYLQWGQGVTAGGQEDNVEGQEVNDGGQEVNVGGQLIEPRSGECLSVQGIPVRAASVKPLVLMPCNASDIRQYWLCNKHSVSDLILGMRGTIDYYITLNHNNGLIHTSQNKLDGLEFVSYDDRSNPVELDVCRFQNRHFSQKVSCLRSAGWIPDPSLIHCDVIMCPEPPGLKNAKMKASGEYSYGSVIRYDCNIGHEYLRGRSSFESR